MTTQSTPGASLPGDRVAVQLQWYLRTAAALGAISALGYAAVLGWRTDANGIVTAAAFAVGFLFATFALAGVVPANIKVGDVEVKLQQARERGAYEGRVEGLAAGADISKSVAAGDLLVERVETALRTALTSPESLRIDGVELPIAQLPPSAAEAKIHAVADALATVAKHSGRPI
ncbi:MAG TPA: hypothetical protein VFQ77_22635 [Pseudonocardiaceae bacterium]|jgi:hypothetical protein|nr:hypothetical protein [Pseudonocardiaceae bacterium]